MSDKRRICFVVMGFGNKTDFETGRTLDLDSTYEAIIRPSVEDQGLRCIRADEIMHSGMIDREMYEMLLRADLVIADISTGNVNAVYELGVRHALRPNSTIIMKEDIGRLYFDLNHTSTFQYEHLGKDIGSREAARARRSLGALIKDVMNAQKPDSPVYTFLPKLERPRLSEEEFAALVDEAEAAQNEFAALLSAGKQASSQSEHVNAIAAYEVALKFKPDDMFLVQQLALATYKSKLPSELEALFRGMSIINTLSPEQSNDPETVGIAGAIRKRLWLLTSDRIQLDMAIRLYSRGFEVRRDYYTGENLATCFDMRSLVQSDRDEAKFDRMSAQKVRQAISESLRSLIATLEFSERTDRKWVFATLANCSFALGEISEGEKYEALFLAEKPAEWEITTYLEGKRTLGIG